MTRHRGVVNFIHYHTKEFSTARPCHNVTQSISINFDASWTELALGLFNGGALHIVESIAQMTGPELAAYLSRHEITIFTSTPAIINNLPREPVPGLEYLICGGDVGSKSAMDYWSGQLKYYNAYGPTEATVCTTYSRHNSNRSNRNIGKPLDNKKAYILTGRNIPAPIGVYGELYIGGEGLATGYLNRPELTAERFVDNPFATGDEKRASRNLKMYKTGDLARWLPDGSIEFSRRNDDQVKISGFRLELGEIENRLAEHPAVSQCAVTCRERQGNKYLAAYYVAGASIASRKLALHLSGMLPYYMVPSYFIRVTDMPLSASGKIDRKQLPEPEFTADEENYAPPRNETETVLCRLWQEALGMGRVGINDDFFRLGGTSITAIKLSHRMTQKLQREIPVASIFTRKTVRGISEALAGFKQMAAIEPCKDDKAALSFAQARLLFIETYQGGSNAYNIPMLFELTKEADIPALKRAIESIIKRHDVLRTVFARGDTGDFYQKVLKTLPAIEDINSTENKIFHEAAAAVNSVFDLHKAPPVKIVFYHTGSQVYLLITIHHIAFDGWSADLFLKELDSFYHCHTDGIPPVVPDLDIQYRDFAVWQRNDLSGERLEKALAYWKQELDGCEPLHLPLDRPRPPQVQYAGDDVDFSLDPALSTGLKTVVKEYGTTPYTVFLAAFNILLHKYSSQTDIVVGSPTANRQYTQVENLIGFFVNSTPMRCRLSPGLCIADLIENTASIQAGMQMFQDLPFEKLIENLKVEQDPSRHPLFQVMFGVQSFGKSAGSNGMGFLRQLDTSQLYKTAKFDLSLFINDAGETITGSFNYAVALFNRETIQTMAGHYCNILKIIAAGGNPRIRDVPLLSAAELDRIINRWNGTTCPYPHDKTIVQAFEEQAAGTPDSPALVFNKHHLTYRELNQRANRLAHTIKRAFREYTGKVIKADTLIGLYMAHSFDMFTAILGILKAGAAYVPFDPDDPQERLKFKIKDCGCQMVLTASGYTDDLLFLTENKILPFAVDEHQGEIEQSPGKNPEPARQAKDLAYVIYTSGSTGKPKGVMIEHYGVINLTTAHKRSFNITGESTLLQLASISFDASVSTMFCALLNGARLCLCDRETRKNIPRLARLIEKEAITHIDITPRLLELLPRDLDSNRLEYIITAGEVCDRETMAHWCGRVKVINAYGPTEATVCTTFAEYSPEMSNHHIGRPIANKKVYVLDSDLNPVPVGSPGELYIGGDGLARGYLNRPELTSRHFLSNKFISGNSHHGLERRIYKTGDLVRWVTDGGLEFIGRNDDQVKVAGFRIELGEIENRLASVDGIKRCVVTLNQREATRYLCAYYTESRDLTADEIRHQLSASLPDYMIPSCFVKLAEFPLNTSGKIDRQSLPEPDLIKDPDNFEAPRNPTEETLCQIWQEILGVDKVGIHDDFFRFGGNSILAIKLSHRMSQVLGQEIALMDIFRNRTINGFSLAGDCKKMEQEGDVVDL